ncbi:MAG: TrmB family transcriptional regulator [Myxococcales bacterium]|nr:TrmB family transcriptional regulator [Myxococcales bacterium]
MSLGDEIEDQVVAAMRSLGYTGSDARTYITLLRGHPATGYELAARGGIPRSAIYSVLKRLERAGLVNAVKGKPARYVPIPPDRLADHLKTRFARDLESFERAVAQVMGPQSDAVTWTVTGYEAVLAEAERLIAGAQRRVIASLWRREAQRLAPAFGRAREAGVAVTLFSFTDLPPSLGDVLCYGIDEARLGEHWPRRIILVADNAPLLVGDAEGSRLDRAVVSDEAPLVEMAIANLVLDITLFGERNRVDTSAIVARLTDKLAPIDELSRRPNAAPPR